MLSITYQMSQYKMLSEPISLSILFIWRISFDNVQWANTKYPVNKSSMHKCWVRFTMHPNSKYMTMRFLRHKKRLTFQQLYTVPSEEGFDHNTTCLQVHTPPMSPTYY